MNVATYLTGDLMNFWNILVKTVSLFVDRFCRIIMRKTARFVDHAVPIADKYRYTLPRPLQGVSTKIGTTMIQLSAIIRSISQRAT